MVGLGTVINTLAIVSGGVLGALFGRFLSDSAQDTLTKVCGVSTLFIALSGALEGMLKVDGCRCQNIVVCFNFDLVPFFFCAAVIDIRDVCAVGKCRIINSG